MEGRILTELPREGTRRAPGPEYDWDKYAKLAIKNPKKVVMAAEHVRLSRVTSLRGYRREPFVSDKGRIVISMRNSKMEDDGHRYGDVFFQWSPATRERNS